jgi:hypothetical protein
MKILKLQAELLRFSTIPLRTLPMDSNFEVGYFSNRSPSGIVILDSVM